ncbi:MAG: hypothetical protein AAGJ08_21340 [Cyanobacteria bacterium P01_H01_bin.35]
MTDLKMPPERNFGWELKPTSSTYFDIHQRKNGQFCVVLNHSLLRGVNSEMIHWWFKHFQTMKVRLDDIEGYENQVVPGYLLWHPSDHHSISLAGTLGRGNTAQAGATITIREAMQYLKYGWKYKVDNKLKIFYCEADGWAMGREIPILGTSMVLRIHFKDVIKDGETIGVHYHYEVVIGLSADNFIARQINKKISHNISPEFFEAWHLHNTIEVGVFENFLPALYAQREHLDNLHYSKNMNPDLSSPATQIGFNKALFEKRLQGYKEIDNPFLFQQFKSQTFL